MNIETNELIRRLRFEEDVRHAKILQDEEDRHNQELQLISNLHETISSWEETLKSSKPADGPEPEPAPKRRGPKPGAKRGRKPAVTAAAPAPAPAKENRGYVPMREKIAKAAAVNVSAEARAWIAENKAPFTMDQIVDGLSKKIDLNVATIRSRLFPFLSYLEERGQMVVTGEKRNYVYTPTESFDPNPKRGGGSTVTTTPPPAPSEKEKLWQELRSKMPSAQRPED